ncbi:hypothetical protein MTZ49_09075 [Entomomonas sp. E2T0]|uniref:hypothetical protein n=1 Tax=Entomomonas sp. E2T0 TaxID=2930213 RepID=UPI0022282D7B|nr:hypothetical protein [Entomomonas sp. E2T0]UYZ82766.1 hypothetical protein MTZ49_09075 [Entomomonas sp. E2T0]
MATATCKPIYNLKFGTQSKQALERIREQVELYKLGSALLLSSTIHTIFTKSSNTFQIGFNIGAADWELLATVAGDWPNVVKNIIAKEAALLEINSTGVEAEFWGGLSSCLKN